MPCYNCKHLKDIDECICSANVCCELSGNVVTTLQDECNCYEEKFNIIKHIKTVINNNLKDGVHLWK